MVNVGDLMRYEDGEMRPVEETEFFARLVEGGEAWNLQGAYARNAQALIDNGLIFRDSEGSWVVDYEALDEVVGPYEIDGDAYNDERGF